MEFKLETSVNHNIGTLAVLLKRQVFRIIADNELEITPDQWVILYYLWQENGLSVGKIASQAKKDFANVTRIIDKLEKLGYVIKRKSDKDSRMSNIFVLPKADLIKDKIQKCMLVSTDIALNGIEEEEQISFLNTLAKIEKNILENLE